MTVFKYFIKSAFRQKWIILGYAMIFFVLSIINGSQTQNKESSFIQTNLNIGVVDKSGSELSQGLTMYLDKANTIIPMEDDMGSIKEEIFLRGADSVIIIPEDFQSLVENKEKSIEIVRDDRALAPQQIENEINKYLAFAMATYKEGAFHLDKAQLALDKEVEVELLKGVTPSKTDGVNIWFRYYFNFASYVIIAIYVAVIGLIMTDFNTKDIQDRTKISSKKFIIFNTELYLGQVVVGLLISSVFVLGGLALKGKFIAEVDLFKYIINLYVFSFSMLCFTFLINNLTTSRFVINGVSTVASLGTSFISGVFLPQEFLGEKVLAIAKFFPTYYYVKSNDMNTNSFADIRYNLLMQVLFGIVFLSLGLYFSRTKQRS
ncbi:MAG: ABC transporter permease [Tissierellia bacterium]|jgi:ABC-2 type transport system permease protein|nr:ABC transporter permease [Tissierellia bacterium]